MLLRALVITCTRARARRIACLLLALPECLLVSLQTLAMEALWRELPLAYRCLILSWASKPGARVRHDSTAVKVAGSA